MSGIVERRKEVCPFHPELDKKIGYILDNQAIYMSQTNKIEGILNNGLKSKLEDCIQTANSMKQQMEAIKSFEWFMNLINDFKEKLFINVCKLIFYGSVFFLLTSLGFAGGNKLWAKVLEKLF